MASSSRHDGLGSSLEKLFALVPLPRVFFGLLSVCIMATAIGFACQAPPARSVSGLPDAADSSVSRTPQRQLTAVIFPVTQDFFRATISATGEPLLMQPVTLTLAIAPLADCMSTTITLFLPDSVELLSGELEQRIGPVRRGDTFAFKVTLRSLQPGESRLRVYVHSTLPDGHEQARTYFAFLSSSKDRGLFSSKTVGVQTIPSQQYPAQGGH